MADDVNDTKSFRYNNRPTAGAPNAWLREIDQTTRRGLTPEEWAKCRKLGLIRDENA